MTINLKNNNLNKDYKILIYNFKNMNNVSKKYLTIKEVANILGVTTLTLRNWDKKKKLKAYRNPINNYRVYKPEEIQLFLRKIESRKGPGNKIFLG